MENTQLTTAVTSVSLHLLLPLPFMHLPLSETMVFTYHLFVIYLSPIKCDFYVGRDRLIHHDIHSPWHIVGIQQIFVMNEKNN